MRSRFFSIVEKQAPSVIVSDINLTGMSGHELLVALQKKES